MAKNTDRFITNEGKHTIVSIDRIDKIREIIEDLVKNKKLKVLLVCDIDDTLIRPNSDINIGTDPWFNFSMKNEDVDIVRKKLSMIYAILSFYGVEKETDRFVASLDVMQNDIDNQLKYICLTSRNVPFHYYTTMHLKDAGYANVFVKKNALDVDNHLYMCAENEGEEVEKENTTNITTPSVRYLDNICCVSGTDKGYVLSELIKKHHYANNASQCLFDIVVFIDDSINNVTRVNNAMKKFINHDYLSHITSISIHYTYMEEHKKNYSSHHFDVDTEKMNLLIKVRDEINSHHSI